MEPSRKPGEVAEERNVSDAVLLQDEQLMQRIDACHSHDFVRENHPDRCPGCGKIEPGFRYCRGCGHHIKRKTKDACFWFQEVAGEAQYQDALERVIEGAERDEDGVVHEWVTAVLITEPSNEHDEDAVKVLVTREPQAELVGHIPQDDAAAIRKALVEVYSKHRRLVACKGLIQGGFRRQDGSTSSYGMKLLLPLPRDIPRAAKAALDAE